ncbi:MAG: transposase zinc-binding domain-containing protein, partial [Cryomorphaceae bacterium]
MADVLEIQKEYISSKAFSGWRMRTLHAIRRCRTPAMGGHIDRCDNPACHKLHISYNSCRNRHCPTCQGHKREAWIQARESELLNVPYFHVVFTLPSELRCVALKYPRAAYKALFKAAWETLKQFGENPKHLGAQVGMIAILHTWGQQMSLHPHLHCIVPGGGVTKSGKWKPAKNKGKYLFNVESMSIVFRAKYVHELRKSRTPVPQAIYDKVFKKDWV